MGPGIFAPELLSALIDEVRGNGAIQHASGAVPAAAAQLYSLGIPG
jgi:hypothetical protein